MRFAIIDDRPETVEALADLIRSQGHEVFAVAFTSEEVSPGMRLKFDLITRDVRAAAKGIKRFKPSFVLVDHDLGDYVTGADVIHFSGLSPDRCIGMSRTFERQKSYCGIQAGFDKNALDVAIWVDREQPRFLNWLKALVDNPSHPSS